MRLFLGLPWPEAAADDLARRALVWTGRPALRLVKKENWHVTLRFLGETEADRVDDLTKLLDHWVKGRRSPTFVDRGWSRFGPLETPRTIFLNLEALPDVRRGVELFHKALDTAGFPGDGKPWKPHVTLAYGKGGNLGPWPTEVPGGRPPVIFPRAVLYESDLGPAGSTYRELCSFNFPR